MAGKTHVGNLTFGIKPETHDLHKASVAIDKFAKKFTTAAKAQKKGTEQATKAQGNQLKALTRAFSAVEKYQKSVNSSNASERRKAAAIKVSTRVLNEFVATVGKGTMSTDVLRIHTLKLKESMSSLGVSIKKVQSAETAARKKKEKMVDTMRNLESASVLAIGPLSGLGARIRSLGAIAGRSSLGVVALFGVVTAITVAFWKMSAASLNAFQIFESATARFKAATGSLALARKEMKFLTETSEQFGLRLQDTTKAYSRLTAASKGTALEGAGVRKIFLSVSKAAAALRLNQQEVQGAFRAIEQIMSKGTVQAEELRGQLGERLPGAFRIAAEAMGVTTRQLGDLMKKGEITSEQFLPKFAAGLEKAFGAEAEANVNSYTGSMNNLHNAFLQFAKEWDRVSGTSKLFIVVIKGATSLIKIATRGVEKFGKGLAAIMAGLITYYLPAIAMGLKGLFIYTKGLVTGTAAWNAMLAANPIGGLVTMGWRLVAAIGAAAASWGLMSWFIDDTTDDIMDSVTEAEKLQETIEGIGKSSGQLSKPAEKVRELTQELKNAQAAMARGQYDDLSAELFFKQFQILDEYDGKTDFEDMAKRLSAVLGKEVAPNIDSVAAAVFKATEALAKMHERMAADAEAASTLADAQKQARIAMERLDAVTQGGEQTRYFDAVTAAVLDYQAVLEDSTLSTKQKAEKERLLREALEALFATTEKIADIERERSEQLKADKATTEMMAKATQKLADAQDRLAAAEQGKEALEKYDRVTAVVDKYRDSIAKANMEDEDRQDLIDAYERVIADMVAAEDKIKDAIDAETEATRASNEALREKERLVDRMTKASTSLAYKIAEIAARNRALRSGPADFSYFEQVLKPMQQMKKYLEENGIQWDTNNEAIAEYIALLHEQHRLQGPLGKAARTAAQAVGDMLEGLIMRTKSLSEAIRDLARAILQLMVKQAIIQPMVNYMVGAFMGGGGVGAAAGAAGGGGFGGMGGTMAAGGAVNAGGSYLVGERGPEILRLGAVNGEIIPNHKIGDMGGNQTNLTINAPGADVGTIERIKEIVRTEMAPQIVQAATNNTVAQLNRPRFA